MEGIVEDFSVEVLPCPSSSPSSDGSLVHVEHQQLCAQQEEARSSLQALEAELSSLRTQRQYLEEELVRHQTLRSHASLVASRAAEFAAGEHFPSRGESWAHARSVEDENATIEEDLRNSIAAMATAEKELRDAINLTRQTLLELRRTRLLQKVELTTGGGGAGGGGRVLEAAEGEAQIDREVEVVSDSELDMDCLEVPYRVSEDVIALGSKTDVILVSAEDSQEAVVLSDDEDAEVQDMSSDMSCSEDDLEEANDDILQTGETTRTEEGGGGARGLKGGKEQAVRCIFPVVDSSGEVCWKLGLVRALLRSDNPLSSTSPTPPSMLPAEHAGCPALSRSRSVQGLLNNPPLQRERDAQLLKLLQPAAICAKLRKRQQEETLSRSADVAATSTTLSTSSGVPPDAPPAGRASGVSEQNFCCGSFSSDPVSSSVSGGNCTASSPRGQPDSVCGAPSRASDEGGTPACSAAPSPDDGPPYMGGNVKEGETRRAAMGAGDAECPLSLPEGLAGSSRDSGQSERGFSDKCCKEEARRGGPHGGLQVEVEQGAASRSLSKDRGVRAGTRVPKLVEAEEHGGCKKTSGWGREEAESGVLQEASQPGEDDTGKAMLEVRREGRSGGKTNGHSEKEKDRGSLNAEKTDGDVKVEGNGRRLETKEKDRRAPCRESDSAVLHKHVKKGQSERQDSAISSARKDSRRKSEQKDQDERERGSERPLEKGKDMRSEGEQTDWEERPEVGREERHKREEERRGEGRSEKRKDRHSEQEQKDRKERPEVRLEKGHNREERRSEGNSERRRDRRYAGDQRDWKEKPDVRRAERHKEEERRSEGRPEKRKDRRGEREQRDRKERPEVRPEEGHNREERRSEGDWEKRMDRQKEGEQKELQEGTLEVSGADWTERNGAQAAGRDGDGSAKRRNEDCEREESGPDMAKARQRESDRGTGGRQAGRHGSTELSHERSEEGPATRQDSHGRHRAVVGPGHWGRRGGSHVRDDSCVEERHERRDHRIGPERKKVRYDRDEGGADESRSHREDCTTSGETADEKGKDGASRSRRTEDGSREAAKTGEGTDSQLESKGVAGEERREALTTSKDHNSKQVVWDHAEDGSGGGHKEEEETSNGMGAKTALTGPCFWVLVTELCPTSQEDVPCRRLLEGTREHAQNFCSLCRAGCCTRSQGAADSVDQRYCISPSATRASDVARQVGLEVLGNAETAAQLLCGKGVVEDSQTQESNEGQRQEAESEAEVLGKTSSKETRKEGEGNAGVSCASSPFVASASAVEDAAGCPYSWRCRYSHGTWVPACDVCLVQWNSARALQAMLEAAHDQKPRRQLTSSEAAEGGDVGSLLGSSRNPEGGGKGDNGGSFAPLFFRGKPVWVREHGSAVWSPGRLLQAIRKQRATGGEEANTGTEEEVCQGGKNNGGARRTRRAPDANAGAFCTRDGHDGGRTEPGPYQEKGRDKKTRNRRVWSMYARVAAEEGRREGRKRIIMCRADQVCPRVVAPQKEAKAVEEESQGSWAPREEPRSKRDENEREVERGTELSEDIISVTSGTEAEEVTSGDEDEEVEDGDIPWEKLRRLGSLLGVDASELRDTLSSTSVRSKWKATAKTTTSGASSGVGSGETSCPLSSSSHFGCWMLYTSGMGLRMMQKWGYRPGECLGKRQRLQRQQKPGEVAGGGEPPTQATTPSAASRGRSRLRAEESSDDEEQEEKVEKADQAEKLSGRRQGAEDAGEEREVQEAPPLPALINPLGIRVLPPRLSLDFISDPSAWSATSKKRRRKRPGDRPSSSSAGDEGMWNYAEGALLPSFGGAAGMKAAARKAQVENDAAFNLINSIYAGGRGMEALRGSPGTVVFGGEEQDGKRSRKSNGDGTGRGRWGKNQKRQQFFGGGGGGGRRGQCKSGEADELGEWLQDDDLKETDFEEARRKQEENDHREKLQALRRNKGLGEKALRQQLFQVQQQQRLLQKEVEAVSANRQRHVAGEGGIGAFAFYYGGLEAAKMEQLKRMKEEESVLMQLIDDRGKEKKLKVF